MTITKAIIPVAGWGTRRLPITKAIEKCMLPIGNRPIVDYVVQDCIQAGITDIYFVVSEESTQIRAYYGDNRALNKYLEDKGKAEMLQQIAPPTGTTFHYVVQPSGGKYGTAVPVALAAEYVADNESVVVLMGDDFLYNKDGSSEVARLLAGTPEGQNGILGVIVPENDTTIARYGFIETNENSELIRIVEHPDLEPEKFIKNVSKYVLNSTMVDAIKSYVEEEKMEGEYGIFDPFERILTQGEIMKVIPAIGAYLDGGTLEGWLHANNAVAGKA
ncbi:MAG: putative UTP--glucose-phosphate uridylyltransferase [Candidatus Saccharibacteria bacterium]|nr:putative UTP--glucose-phosphate uridylyltransferase [Candidatus Saccharibacteria bacterium]